MSSYTPIYTPGNAITRTASADVKGGRWAEVTGEDTVAHAAAASTKVVGVLGHDAKQGERVTIYSGGVQCPDAADAITAGALVQAAADGKTTTSDGAAPLAVLGVAHSTTTTDGESVEVHER